MSWSLLASSARCCVLTDQDLLDDPLLVEGCTGSTPEHMQPWTIFLRELEFVQGLPLHHFVQLEPGWFVWRKRAAAAFGLDKPELCGLDSEED